MTGNILGCSLVVVERLRLRELQWGNTAHVNGLLSDVGPVDIVVGADVVYVEEAVPALFDSIAKLLDPAKQVRPLDPHCACGENTSVPLMCGKFCTACSSQALWFSDVL